MDTLFTACIRGKLVIVKELIKAGANIEAKDNNCGWTVLMYASNNDRLEVVKELELKIKELNEIREMELMKYLYKKITKNIITYAKL